MIKIEGNPHKGGIAIAVAAIITSRTGISGISSALLKEGMAAVRQYLPQSEYPEAVVVCDNPTLGYALKIPGIRTIAVASEADADIEELSIDVPCVTGLPNLLDSITEGVILIVDGNKGVVYIDPDVQTLIHYQQVVEQDSRQKVFVASAHIPAQTQRGEMVMVYGYVTTDKEVDQAIEQGADGLFIDIPGPDANTYEHYQSLLQIAAGKSLAIVVESSPYELLRAAMRYAAPEQITLLVRLSDFDYILGEIESAMQNVEVEAFLNDLAPPVANLGLLALETDYSEEVPVTYHRAVDLRKSDILEDTLDDLQLRLEKWVESRNPEEVILIIGDGTEVVSALVEIGARCLAVKSDRVADAKYAIRSVGLEEVE